MTYLAERLCHCDLAKPCPLGRERRAGVAGNLGGRCSIMMYTPQYLEPPDPPLPHFNVPDPMPMERVEAYIVRSFAKMESFVNLDLVPWLSRRPPPS